MMNKEDRRKLVEDGAESKREKSRRRRKKKTKMVGNEKRVRQWCAYHFTLSVLFNLLLCRTQTHTDS